MLKTVQGEYFTVSKLEMETREDKEIFSIVREYTDLYINEEELKELVKLAQIILDDN